MIKHIVMWKLHETASGRSKEENATLLKQKLEAMPEQIPELKKAEVGVNSNPSDAAWDVVLYSEFDHAEALQTYQKHPFHQALIHDFLNKVRTSKAVVDYEI